MLFRKEVSVIIHLPDCKVEGKIRLPLGGQISKILRISRRSEDLLPIYQAKVHHLASQLLEKNPSYLTDCLLINRDYIVMINPLLGSKKKEK